MAIKQEKAAAKKDSVEDLKSEKDSVEAAKDEMSDCLRLAQYHLAI